MRVKTGLQCFLIFGLFVAIFFPIYPEWLATWMNQSDNSHGFLVPFVSLYLVWGERQRLQCCEVRPSWTGFCVLALCLLAYLLAFAGGTAVFSRCMFVFSLAALVLFLWGGQIFRVLAFPLFFMLFMVPVPISVIGLVSLPLQSLATHLSSEVIQFCSIPVLREGNMLYFVQTQLEVAEACSGIRSIVSLLMLGTLFVYFSRQGFWVKTMLLLSALPIALLANILRISGTGILAHFYGDHVAQGFLHEFSGMVVFVFGLIVLGLEYFLLARIFRHGRRKIAGEVRA